MEILVLKIGGMSCGGCERSVANVLSAVPGVRKAQVSLERGEARVVFDPAKTGTTRIKRAILDAGYQAD